MAFGFQFRRRLDSSARSDKQPNNVRIYNIDPGLIRTPGSRRWITMGCLCGLGIYLVTWLIWWLVSKDKEERRLIAKFGIVLIRVLLVRGR